MTTAVTLAGFATDTRFEHLPPSAVEHAKCSLASTIASAAMGRDIDSAKAFREMAKERGGTPEATLWFDGGPKLPVMDAARTNAIMSDSAASGDSDLAAHAHLGTVTCTAAALTPLGGLSQQKIDKSLEIVQRFEEAHSVSA